MSNACGTLHLTTSTGTVEHQGTKASVDFTGILSLKVDGQGCFNLYANSNYRSRIKKVKKVDNRYIYKANPCIPSIKSIEFFLDCKKRTGGFKIKIHTSRARYKNNTIENNNNIENSNNVNSNNKTENSLLLSSKINNNVFSKNDTETRNNNYNNRCLLGGALCFSSFMMAVILLLKFKELKRKAPTNCKDQFEMDQAPGEREECSGNSNSNINYSHLWQEIVGWRGNMAKEESCITILLSLIPSACDVSSDYSYAKTWNEEGFNPQIKALVYFFICLLHLVTLLTVTRWWIYKTLASCSSCSLWVKRLGKATATCLFLALLLGLTIASLLLIWFHPNVFAYFALVCGALTVGFKAASVCVQGPQMKKAMTLLTAS